MACNSPLQIHGRLDSIVPPCYRGKTDGLSRRIAIAGISTSGSSRRLTKSRAATGDLRLDMIENPEGIISGEWPENFSLLSYDDLRAYLETHVISKENPQRRPAMVLREVMSTPVKTATAEQSLAEIDHHFEVVSGLPVVDSEMKCVGVVSKKDIATAINRFVSKVAEVMSSPAITIKADKNVMDAAALMLKMKIHMIPIINDDMRLIGIVTRTDIFKALETSTI